MPTGKVKFYNAEKGFGFLSSDEGADVFLHASALPEGVTELKGGTRVEYGIVEGKRGTQALSVRVLEAPPSMQRMARPSADDMAARIEDLIKVLDREGAGLRRGRYPDSTHGRRIASLLRRVADDFDS